MAENYFSQLYGISNNGIMDAFEYINNSERGDLTSSYVMLSLQSKKYLLIYHQDQTESYLKLSAMQDAHLQF